jgi:type III restriction enzyme
MANGIDKLIINSAFCEPKYHWKYNLNRQAFDMELGRRPAGYFVAGQGSNAYNDIGQFSKSLFRMKIDEKKKNF